MWRPAALRGFPSEALQALGHTPTDATYAAWIHARHGHEADWLERHLHLEPVIAELLCAHARQMVSADL
jgi:hypothetical protein